MLGFNKELLNYIQPFKESFSNYTSLLKEIGEAEYIFIGESTHGSEEFYRIRAEISKRLILEKGFNAIVIEGDWPDAYRINSFVKGDNNIKDSMDALAGFQRFPTWMWRNQVTVKFIEWLYAHNSKLEEINKIGFYGFDLYSLNASIETVIKFLEKEDVTAAARAKRRYGCFDYFKEELQSYGYTTALGITPTCEKAVIEQLIELNANSPKYLQGNGVVEEELFSIIQNACLIKNAEKYYRSILEDRKSSWNIRDAHMMEILNNIIIFLTKKLNKAAKVIVWAHNSHIGDARATASRSQQQLNIGQLAKEKYNDKVILIGFLTHSGTVTAASSWDGVTERKIVRPALNNSYENLFHSLTKDNFQYFLLNFKESSLRNLMPVNMLERAIGVIYSPETERLSHYFYADLSKQFDMVIYLDSTTALKPLETTAIWHKGEVFETFPSGL